MACQLEGICRWYAIIASSLLSQLTTTTWNRRPAAIASACSYASLGVNCLHGGHQLAAANRHTRLPARACAGTSAELLLVRACPILRGQQSARTAADMGALGGEKALHRPSTSARTRASYATAGSSLVFRQLVPLSFEEA